MKNYNQSKERFLRWWMWMEKEQETLTLAHKRFCLRNVVRSWLRSRLHHHSPVPLVALVRSRSKFVDNNKPFVPTSTTPPPAATAPHTAATEYEAFVRELFLLMKHNVRDDDRLLTSIGGYEVLPSVTAKPRFWRHVMRTLACVELRCLPQALNMTSLAAAHDAFLFTHGLDPAALADEAAADDVAPGAATATADSTPSTPPTTDSAA